MDTQVANAAKAMEDEDVQAIVRHLRPVSLPEEFGPDKIMTRVRFNRGIYKYLASISK